MVRTRTQLPEDFRDTSGCVYRHMSMTARAICAAYDAAFLPANLSAHQFALLSALAQGGPQSVRDLAYVLGMEASGIPRAVKPLAERGLVTVAIGRDRRQRIVALSGLGLKALRAALPAWRRLQAHLVRDFGEGRWQATVENLAELRQLSRQQIRAPRRQA
jgi:DNA-binding MarR family transcriptional regulator